MKTENVKKTDRKMITWTKTDRQPLFDLKIILKPVSNFSPWQRWDWSPAASLTSKYQPGIFQKSIGFPPVFHQIRLEIRRLSPFHGFSTGFSILQTTNQQIARFRTTDRMKKESRCTMAMACVRSRNSWIHILAAIVVFQWEVDVYT